MCVCVWGGGVQGYRGTGVGREGFRLPFGLHQVHFPAHWGLYCARSEDGGAEGCLGTGGGALKLGR